MTYRRRRVLHALSRISLAGASFLCLPVLILILVPLRDGVRRHTRISIAQGLLPVRAPSTALFHHLCRDNLLRWWARLRAPAMPTTDRLPHYRLQVANADVAYLEASLGRHQSRPALLCRDDQQWPVRIRYLGDNHWHRVWPQKSWRVSLRGDHAVDGVRRLGLKNPRRLFSALECVSQELARQVGLLAPLVEPIKLSLNGNYQGLYLRWDPIDETFLRHHRRPPGNIYGFDDGPKSPIDGTALIWHLPQQWSRYATRTTPDIDRRSDLYAFLAAVNSSTDEEFYRFASTCIDNEAYARFVALDNLLGGSHHDHFHNHRWYVDPVRGRFVPISWDFGDWHLDEQRLDVESNPLLDRWKSIPSFDLLRKRKLHEEILEGAFSRENIVSLLEEYRHRIRPALAADHHRDALRPDLLEPLQSEYIPVAWHSMQSFDDNLEALLEALPRRIAAVSAAYADGDFSVQRRLRNDAPRHSQQSAGTEIPLACFVGPGGGRRLTAIDVSGTATALTLYRDLDGSRTVSRGDQAVVRQTLPFGGGTIAVDELLLPGWRPIERRGKQRHLYGTTTLVPAPQRFDYLIAIDDGELWTVAVQTQNAVTGKTCPVTKETKQTLSPQCATSMHQWNTIAPSKRNRRPLILGPGSVCFDAPLILEEMIELQIEPGTTIELNQGAYILCRGPVTARGTPTAPISFSFDRDDTTGSFLLLGRQTAGSRFSHCHWKNGAAGRYGLVVTRGMVNVHAAADIEFEHCHFSDNRRGDDLLHIASSEEILVAYCTFSRSVGDCLDADNSTVRVVQSTFATAANDGIDLCDTTAEICNITIADARDKGLSIGEGSFVTALTAATLRRCRIGIEVRDGAFVRLGSHTICDCEVAMQCCDTDRRYPGSGVIDFSSLTGAPANDEEHEP